MVNKRNRAKQALKAPNLPAELERWPVDKRWQEQEYYTQLAVTHSNFSSDTSRNLAFDQIVFKQVDMTNTHWEKIHVVDSRFDTCDIANADWPAAGLHRVELLGCHLTGWRMFETQIQDTVFRECSGAFAQFALSRFKAVRFEDCDLTEANFHDADLTGVVFSNCNLTGADFAGTKLVGADLRGSRIDGLHVGPLELIGATIDPTQAIAFIKGSGIKVALPDELL